MPTNFCTIQIRLQCDLYANLLVIVAGNFSICCLFVCLFLPRESVSIALYIEQIHTRLGIFSVLLIFGEL